VSASVEVDTLVQITNRRGFNNEEMRCDSPDELKHENDDD